MGLFDTLMHWYYETIDLEWDDNLKYAKYNVSSNEYDLTFLKDISENLLSKDKEETKLKYIGLTLRSYYIIFLFGICVHYTFMRTFFFLRNQYSYIKPNSHCERSKNVEEVELGNLKSKSESVTLHKEQITCKLTMGNYFTHIFASIVIPDILVDWDDEEVQEEKNEEDNLDSKMITASQTIEVSTGIC